MIPRVDDSFLGAYWFRQGVRQEFGVASVEPAIRDKNIAANNSNYDQALAA